MKFNEVMKTLKEDRVFSKSELSQFKCEPLKDIYACIRKLDYDDCAKLSDLATEITGEREDSIYARYVLGCIAFVRRPHEDNIFMQNLLITFYDNHNWTVVEYLCSLILEFNENKLALRILSDCYEETDRADQKWPVLERLVKIDFDEKKITRQIGDHYLEAGDKDNQAEAPLSAPGDKPPRDPPAQQVPRHGR